MANPFFYKKQMDTTYINPSTSPTTWKDQSTNSLNLTLKAAGEPLFSFGNAASSYKPLFVFDGSDDYASFANNEDIDFNHSDFSIQIKIKTTYTGASHTVIQKGDDVNGGGVTPGWRIYVQGTTGFLGFVIDDNSGDRVTTLSTISVADGVEHDIIVTADKSGNASIYIDSGTAENTGDISAVDSIENGDGLYIGASFDGAATEFFYNGDLGLVFLYNYLLTSADVTEIMADPTTVRATDQYGKAGFVTGTDRDMSGANNWVNNGLGTFDINSTVAGKMYMLGDGAFDRADLDAILTSGDRYFISLLARLNAGASTTIRVGGDIETVGPVAFEITPTGTETRFTGVITADSTDLQIGLNTADGGFNGIAFEIDDVLVIKLGVVSEWRLAHENSFSPFEFPKGRQLPVNFPIVPRQIVGVAGGGQTVVDNLGNADERWPINVLRVSATAKNNLLGFLQDTTVNYRENVFQFVEEDATDNEVRLWEPFPLDFPRVPGSLFNLALVVRKEIS